MERKAYFQELSTCLQREGFTILPEENDLLSAEWNGTLTQQIALHQVFYMYGAKSTSLLEKHGRLDGR